MALHRGGGRRTCDVLSRVFFFFQAEDGIRDLTVTGVQTCALPISCAPPPGMAFSPGIHSLFWCNAYAAHWQLLPPASDFRFDRRDADHRRACRSEEHTSELQSQSNLVCRLLLEKKKHKPRNHSQAD